MERVPGKREKREKFTRCLDSCSKWGWEQTQTLTNVSFQWQITLEQLLTCCCRGTNLE